MKRAVVPLAVAAFVSCEEPRVRKPKKRVPPVVSAPRERCMYTTWRRDYSRLEEFARLMGRGELIE